MNTSTWEIYQDPLLYKFRLVSSNGKILMKSNNDYATEQNARNAISVIKNLIPSAVIILKKY